MLTVEQERLVPAVGNVRAFYEYLKLAPIRKVRKRKVDTPEFLTSDECLALLLIGELEINEGSPLEDFHRLIVKACEIINPIYKRYISKGKNVMPEMVIKCVHYVFYMNCHFKESSKHFTAKDIFTLLGMNESTFFDKNGIQPIDDYFFAHYKPLLFLKVPHRDSVLHEVLHNLLYFCDCSMFIDVTGEHMILSDFYPWASEVACFRCCVALNFYNALVHKNADLMQMIKSSFASGVAGNSLEKYNLSISKARDEFYENEKVTGKYSEAISVNTLKTFLFDGNRIDVVLAQQYFALQLHELGVDVTHPEIAEEVISYLEQLRNRLKGVSFALVSPKDLFKVAESDSMRIPRLKKENEVFKEEHFKPIQCYSENLDREKERHKRGFLFYDFILDGNVTNVAFFAEFVRKSRCVWAFVCKKSDVACINLLASNSGDNIHRIYVTERLRNYTTFANLPFNVDTVIITNAVSELFMNGVTTTDENDIPAMFVKKLDDKCLPHPITTSSLVFVEPNTLDTAFYNGGFYEEDDE
jgi:hypothetical protein